MPQVNQANMHICILEPGILLTVENLVADRRTKTRSIRVALDGKMPRYPRQVRRGSLCQFQPILFPCEADAPD